MRGHNICFYAELTKIVSNYHQILPLIYRALLPVCEVWLQLSYFWRLCFMVDGRFSCDTYLEKFQQNDLAASIIQNTLRI